MCCRFDTPVGAGPAPASGLLSVVRCPHRAARHFAHVRIHETEPRVDVLEQHREEVTHDVQSTGLVRHVPNRDRIVEEGGRHGIGNTREVRGVAFLTATAAPTVRVRIPIRPLCDPGSRFPFDRRREKRRTLVQSDRTVCRSGAKMFSSTRSPARGGRAGKSRRCPSGRLPPGAGQGCAVRGDPFHGGPDGPGDVDPCAFGVGGRRPVPSSQADRRSELAREEVDLLSKARGALGRATPRPLRARTRAPAARCAYSALARASRIRRVARLRRAARYRRAFEGACPRRRRRARANGSRDQAPRAGPRGGATLGIPQAERVAVERHRPVLTFAPERSTRPRKHRSLCIDISNPGRSSRISASRRTRSKLWDVRSASLRSISARSRSPGASRVRSIRRSGPVHPRSTAGPHAFVVLDREREVLSASSNRDRPAARIPRARDTDPVVPSGCPTACRSAKGAAARTGSRRLQSSCVSTEGEQGQREDPFVVAGQGGEAIGGQLLVDGLDARSPELQMEICKPRSARTGTT